MASTATTNTDPLLIDARELMRLLCVSAATFYRMRGMGRLPRPIRLATRAVRWRYDEVRAWIAANCPPADVWDQRARRPGVARIRERGETFFGGEVR